MQINSTTNKDILSIPWVVPQSSGTPEYNRAARMDVNRTGERSSDGKWLKRNVKFAKAPKAQSATNVETASKYGCDAEDLFL